ncbi:MAG: tetratricopeptide repeat protein [Bryobacterales bacterium]|nr:tetratricopeptide repeat protein [Bryobacterales bacterium]
MIALGALAGLLLLPQQEAGECPLLLEEAQRAIAIRRADDAVLAIDRAIRACPPRAELHVSLAQLLFLKNDGPGAERALKTALAIDARHSAARYALGRLYYEQKRYPEAVTELDRVVAADARYFKAWDNLGLCHDALHNDAQALKSFFRALDIVMKDQPTYDWAHANLADFFLRREQYDKAFQLAAEAARRNPESARNALIAGKALVKLEKHDLSLRWLEQAVKLDPSQKDAWYVLSQSYRRVGKREESAKALEKFRALP